MPRLVEIDPSRRKIPGRIVIVSGDIVLLRATGGHVRSGEHAVHFLGAFLTALLKGKRPGYCAVGAPNRVVFVARAAGAAVIDVVTGDPWGESKVTILNISVQEAH